jgi:hypothetical protein
LKDPKLAAVLSSEGAIRVNELEAAVTGQPAEPLLAFSGGSPGHL